MKNIQMNRWIYHIEVNAFYASVEINNNPEYANKPVVVCSDTQSAIITTANYIARSYGITSAMPLSVALRKCPDLIITGLNFDEYKRVSAEFVALCRKYSDKCEQASIDEVYMDVSDIIQKYEKPLDLAIEIQKDIQQTLKLDVSIGIAENMFLAKMASNMRKPNGLTIIRNVEIPTKLWPLPVEKMHGMGQKTVALLKAQNLNTIYDLAHAAYETLVPIFKNHTLEVIEKANGIDHGEVESESSIKSISQSSTLIKPTDDSEEIHTTLRECCIDLSNRLQARNLACKNLILSIKDTNHQMFSRSIVLDRVTNDANDIFELALMIFDDNFSDWEIRNIGIGTNRFVLMDEHVQQMSIFEEPFYD